MDIQFRKKLHTYFIFLIGVFLCTHSVSHASGSNDAISLYASQEQIEKRYQNISDNFMYILPDGNIHPSYSGNKEDLEKTFSPNFQYLKTIDYYNKAYTIIEIDKGQIPNIQLKNVVKWELTHTENSEKTVSGKNFSALGFTTRNVQYYRYDGENPLFSPTSDYNAMSYTSVDNTKEKILDRFLFYRWTGKNMGILLDTYMYAIDTYTGLVFTYVKIGDWKGAFGVEVPTRYDPIDMYKSQDNDARFFFEYDPIGYVSQNGEIVLHDWYIEKTKKKLQVQLKNHLPVGKSPYYVP